MKIKELILSTTHLQEQLSFYGEVLDFNIIKKSESFISFQIGESTLTFKKVATSTPYHFAFNIPNNKEEEAFIWLKQRVEVLPFNNKKIIDFSNWNAKAIYFYDADKNIVEFIARKDYGNSSKEDFNSKQVLNICEIGIGTDSIETIYKQLCLIKPIQVFDGDLDRFCALGDNEGLFIVVDKNKKDWFPTGDKIYTSDFIVKGDYNFLYKNGKLNFNDNAKV